MTVESIEPVERYIGNGSLVHYGYNWDMLPESVIEVRLDNVLTTDYLENIQTIIFNTAPAVGVEILIYRRTPLYQPEDYAFARGFKSNKTELTLDREFMLAAEYEAGVVGAADIFAQIFDNRIVINSERGSDATIPLWSGTGGTVPPDPEPDANIIWAGDTLSLFLSGGADLSVQLRFSGIDEDGQIGLANAFYTSGLSTLSVGWLDSETIAGEYWVRVLNLAGTVGNFTIKDNGGVVKNIGDEFEIVGATVTVDSIGLAVPVYPDYSMDVEISKDNGGVPDGAWVKRKVTMGIVST